MRGRADRLIHAGFFLIIAAGTRQTSAGAAALQPSTSLTLAQRVAAQRAIENVYCSHRTWPKENPGSRPACESVLSASALVARVDDYLRESNALATRWSQRIDPGRLQAEMTRMARDTNAPDVLRELFGALGNDPTTIAETLVRQKLADGLIRDRYAYDDRIHAAIRRQAEGALARKPSIEDLAASSASYAEVTWRRSDGVVPRLGVGHRAGRATIDLDADDWKDRTALLARAFGAGAGRFPLNRWSDLEETRDAFRVTAVLAEMDEEITVATATWRKTPFEVWWSEERMKYDTEIATGRGAYAPVEILSGPCTDDSWQKTLDRDVPDPRTFSTSVWTGSEMIVWGGFGGSYLDTGGRYDPSTDTWRPTSRGLGVPSGRYAHTAVWTGTKMIVWGGDAGYGSSTFNTGGVYDPVADSWSPTSTTAAPAARYLHTVVWTGTSMIVWGGSANGSPTSDLNTGGRYDPTSNTWSPVSTGVNVPSARSGHVAVWTGSRMIVWGGSLNEVALQSGARYDPVANSWQPTSLGPNVPSPRFGAAGIWTGTQLIVWSGWSEIDGYLSTGSRYDPSADAWLPMTPGPNLPAARYYATAVWTGLRMVVWGGYGATYLDTGGRYDPQSDTWQPTSTGSGVPRGRYLHTAVWTGTEMIVWGGEAIARFNNGGRYNPSSDSWTPTSTGAGVPAARYEHSAVWTGAELIVWGGYDGGELASGARYVPATDTWSATTAANAPTARWGHTAVWTGSKMIVWGGYAATPLATGGRYDPALDAWTPTATTPGVPSARYYHTAVWTGGLMIVWGGLDDSATTNTGARYAPATDQWTPTSPTNAPGARWGHTATWTGSRMIVWGGTDFNETTALDTGSRYAPATDTWTSTSLAAAPSPRYYHTASWTGSRMILWGGRDAADNSLNTGSRYDPVIDAWAATSPLGAPSPRRGHTAISTGGEMIVWGGIGALNPSFNTGGRYDPVANSWSATSTGPGTPSARAYLDAVWTGSTMIVWGGWPSKATGGAYCSAPLCSGLPGCDDANSCTADSCNAGTGRCVNAPAGTAVAWYEDEDGDHYGNPAASILACYPPPQYVASNRDCDDGDRRVLPGGREVCDGKRNDCDGAGWPSLLDGDADGIEDACENCTDSDGDGWGNPDVPGNTCAPDNCPTLANPHQDDDDFDTRGNACDPCPLDPLDDGDGDGICGDLDNCPFAANPIQEDFDGDSFGDACDPCPLDPGTTCDPDNDHDGIPDALDPDDDNDTVPEDDGDGAADPCPTGVRVNCDDNCPVDFNFTQRDTDGDGIGDACDELDGLIQGGSASFAMTGSGMLAVVRVPIFSWRPEIGVVGYNVYSGTLAGLPGGSYGSCYRNRIVTEYTTLPENPPIGTAYVYLVTAAYVEREGGLGFRSDGSVRPLSAKCP